MDRNLLVERHLLVDRNLTLVAEGIIFVDQKVALPKSVSTWPSSMRICCWSRSLVDCSQCTILRRPLSASGRFSGQHLRQRFRLTFYTLSRYFNFVIRSLDALLRQYTFAIFSLKCSVVVMEIAL